MADAFGRMVYDYYRDRLADPPVHRRDDGETWDAVLGWYFAAADEWPKLERSVVDRAEGRVLDVGCGPGRTAVYLQERGHEVVGIDRSQLALAVATDRGLVRAVTTDMRELGVCGPFDTILVAGGHLGATGSRFGLRNLLRSFGDLVPSGGRLVADLLDPTAVDDPDRFEYLKRRRIADGVSIRRFRVEYDDLVGPWIDLLFLTPAAFRELARETPWRVVDVERSDGEQYYATLERE